MVDAGLFRTDHPEGAAFFLRPIQQAFGIPRIDGLPIDQVSGRVVVDKNKISKDDKSSGIRSCKDDILVRKLILNTYKTLLTRGQKGCYVYCEDRALAEYFKKKAGTVKH